MIFVINTKSVPCNERGGGPYCPQAYDCVDQGDGTALCKVCIEEDPTDDSESPQCVEQEITCISNNYSSEE